MTLYVVGGLLVALAAVSWFDCRRHGGRKESNEDVFADAPEWGDERDLGLRQAHHDSHDAASEDGSD